MTQSQIVCLGEALVDVLPAVRGQNFHNATRWQPLPGGAAANVAVGLARLGRNAATLAKVGADPFGELLREKLVQEGVETSQLFATPEANTGLSFGWVDTDANGEARYVPFRQLGAYRLLHPDEINSDWLCKVAVLQFGSILLATEPGASATRKALQIATENAIPLVYDVNMRLPAWTNHETARAGMLTPLPLCDVVKLNQPELAFLTGERDVARAAAQLWQPKTHLLVVTLGAEGCYYRTANFEGFVAGYTVKVTDTVGCGDAFMAALINRLFPIDNSFDFDDSEALERVCRYANAAGAFAATRTGAIPAMPTARQLDNFIKAV
jgi:sugar/nucleoside kinase (ribokinase family)